MTAMAVAASHLLRPYWGRVTVLDSPVDEEQRPSGLIVSMVQPEDTCRRGVVLNLDATYHELEGQWVDYARRIDTGTVVYFVERRAVKVLDVWVVDIADILAYEEPE